MRPSDKNKFNAKDYYEKMEKLVLVSSNPDYTSFLLVYTEIFVDSVLGGVTKTQIRNIFELIKGCNTSEELKMTKPKLLYTAGRLSGQAKSFLMQLSKIVIKVKTEEDVLNFNKYIETVLAYHKYYAKS